MMKYLFILLLIIFLPSINLGLGNYLYYYVYIPFIGTMVIYVVAKIIGLLFGGSSSIYINNHHDQK